MNHFSYMFLGRVNQQLFVDFIDFVKIQIQIQIQDWIEDLKHQSEFKIESIWYLIQIQIVARLQLLPAHWTKLCSRRSWNWLGFWGIWKLYKSETSWRTYHQEISWNDILNWQLNMNISQNIFKNTQWFGKTRQGTLWMVNPESLWFRSLVSQSGGFKNSHQKGGAPENRTF